MQLIKMSADIQTSKAQKTLLEASTMGKLWDLSKFKEYNLPSNASGLAKSIRDLTSLLTGTNFGNLAKTIKDKIPNVPNGVILNPKESENDRLRKLREKLKELEMKIK